ncbi:hypothetical protein [Mycoplasmopsis columboralis]|uniref:Lipoprotein n=1 Tax=Mycoplasmopsis columboralis TaxID=171282 RepID=A0A449B6I7_9BACT|nr:hypothetical protein [Mycoplasmopsis columboralis]VEU76172.1 Uncharacterised protein [Mycoplasmopsis columboralis]
MKISKFWIKATIPASIIAVSALGVVSCDNLFKKNHFKNSYNQLTTFVNKVKATANQTEENAQKLQFMLVSLNKSYEVYTNILKQIEENKYTDLNTVSEENQRVLSAQIQTIIKVGEELLKQLLNNTLIYNSLEAITPYMLLDTETKFNFIGMTSAQHYLDLFLNETLNIVQDEQRPNFQKLKEVREKYLQRVNNFFNSIVLTFYQTKVLDQIFTTIEYEKLQNEIDIQKENFLKLAEISTKFTDEEIKEANKIAISEFVNDNEAKIQEFVKNKTQNKNSN